MSNVKTKKLQTATLAAAMVVPTLGGSITNVIASETVNASNVSSTEESLFPPVKDGYTYISKVSSYEQAKNKVTITLAQGERIRFTFLENNVFRMYMAPAGDDFLEYPKPNSSEHTATITNKTDDTYYDTYAVNPTVARVEGESLTIRTNDVNIVIDEATSMMTVTNKANEVIIQETAPLQYKDGSTIQSLATDKNEYFYGGGTQNGRFSHKGENIKIVNSNNWVDGGVASPNPFYWSTKGYGVVRNTWKPGAYDFTGNTSITTTHNEKRFDAYFFVDPTPNAILKDYYELTGNPLELPEYASYLGHLNCYNRDYWIEVAKGTSGAVKLGDKWYKESQSDNGGKKETLNGDDDFTAKSMIEEYKNYDMPFGWFLPNDGYGCGYGQEETQNGNISNLEQFADDAISKGVQTGLWTQSNLYPADPANPGKNERNLDKEVQAGTHSIKTDVAWVGAGYSFALNGVMTAYNGILNNSGLKPNVVSLDGWAGTQRYAGIWSGDQSGGQWEYIRFHIPTYIGTSLSGQPNVGSDMDGIFGGKNSTVQTRDFQWKAFTTYMLDMDGWGSSQKTPWALGTDSESINRAYLKLKAQLMPYINTISHTATASGGLPMIRAMFLEEANAFTYGKATQYQYMWGDNFLVAPIYQETAADADGNDIRNDIYLPATADVWIDYLTGKQYRGGQVLNNFDAPLWKLPVFVKNGSIIPMYSENNNPEALSETNIDGVDRSLRIVEFYPSGSTDFTAYEDDGKTHGGKGTTTKYTSVVEKDKVILTANKTEGTYSGMVNERMTEFIVNVSKEPTSLTGSVGSKDVAFTKVNSLEEYNKAEGNVYFYDETPETIVKQYATDDSKYTDMKETQTPKLRVKSTDKVAIHNHEFQVIINGFENKQKLGKNELDESIMIPTNLQATSVTSDTITLGWDKIDTAMSYDIEVDGTVYRNNPDSSYTHSGLDYFTDHFYRVRSVNEEGNYSNWTEKLSITTDDNPYRNVPSAKKITWTGTIYGNHDANLAFDQVFQNGDGGFHSSNGAIGKELIVDYGKEYKLDKIEYYPRDDAGNGTVTKMDISTSIDGIHWSEPETYNWDRNAKVKTVDYEGKRARYVKFIPKASVGGFFSASEIMVYKLDGTDGKVVGDVNNSGSLEENDLIFFENYAGLTTADKDWDYIQEVGGDIDANGFVDAYDLGYVATQLNGGISNPSKGVEGKVKLVPSKSNIKTGETITVDVYGIGMKNVNSFSLNVPIDNEYYSATPATSSIKTAFMKNFSKNRTHSNNTIDNFVMFTNIGKQDTLNGTEVIASFTLTAKKDFNWSIVPTQAVIVGQDLSNASALIDYSETPVIPETKKILTKAEAPITVTSEDGSVIDTSKLFQQNNWNDILFDGDTSSNMAEFTWDMAGQKDLEDFVKVPVNFTFDISKESTRHISSIMIHGRSSSNGALKKSKLAYINAKGERIEVGKSNAKSPSWKINDDVKQIIWTPLETIGTANEEEGQRENRMLSLHEIEIVEDAAISATGIQFDESSISILKSGQTGEVSATVSPDNVSNPFYNIESSNPEIVSVDKIPMGNQYIFLVTGISKGSATLTAATEDGIYTATREIQVEEGVVFTEVDKLIAETKDFKQSLYTIESWANLQIVIEKAEHLKVSDPTQAEINAIAKEIKLTIADLKFKGSNEEQADSTNLIDQIALTMYDESSFTAAEKEHASNTIDGKKNTIWHSNYNKGYTLPQYFTIDLGEEYQLEQVDYLPRQSNRNGHITHYRIETSLDGKTFDAVVEGYLETQDGSLKDPETAKKIKFDMTEARYVRFIALESLGDSPNTYASCAEINFYGTKAGASYEELQNLIKEANEKIKEDYTTSSWTVFENILAEAKTITTDTTLQGINLVYQSLSIAMDSLEVRANAESLLILQKVVDEANAYIEQGMTSSSLEQVITNAMKLINDPNETTVNEVFMAIIQIKQEIGKLDIPDVSVLKDNLRETIEEIQNSIMYNTEGYREADIQEMEALIMEAVNILKDEQATIEQVKDITIRLADKVTEMVRVNKTALLEAIEKAEGIQSDDYTSESYVALQTAIIDAKAVYENSNATRTDVTNAINLLLEKISNLVLSEQFETEALELEIAMAQNILDQKDKYIASSLEGLDKALQEAKHVSANPESQEAIESAIDNLRKERMEVRIAADKSKLDKAITRAHNVNFNLYTPSSIQAVHNALDNAKDVLGNDEATQIAVDEAADFLNKAIDALKLAETDAGNEDSENNTDNDEGTIDNKNPSENNDHSSNGETTTENKTPDTGGKSDIAGFALLSGISLGGLIAILKKRKHF
ncbi:discoidin domain-containing protein [Erysipelotrichaceae bacterium HCN-30851]